jgi:Uma2 family endonuclease
MKVAIPNESRFYYPDIFITAELKTPGNSHIKHHPELIVEVISKSSYINNTVNKYIDYTKIPSLKYYITVNPKVPIVTVYSKDATGEWQAEEYTKSEDVINLTLLQLDLPIQEIFEIVQEGDSSN